MRVDAAGRIAALSGVPPQGQGLETTLAQVAADELGVTPDGRQRRQAATPRASSTASGSFASRAAVVGGSAVALAARDCAQGPRLAARALGVAEADLEQAGKQPSPTARRPERRVTLRGRWRRLAGDGDRRARREPGLESTRFFQPTDMTYSSGAHVALVEVDPPLAPRPASTATG